MGTTKSRLPVIGWREWVSLPELGVHRIKAKVDTGARSSSVHAFDIDVFSRDGYDWVRFGVLPIQGDNSTSIRVEARVVDQRTVRSSSGEVSMRPVIETTVRLHGITWPVEMTLADRQEMRFRMLLGRQAFRGRFLVHAGRSFLGGRPSQDHSQRASTEDRTS